MARYSLILRDAAYVALVNEASRQTKSFGKLLNEVINDYVITLAEEGPKELKDINEFIVCPDEQKVWLRNQDTGKLKTKCERPSTIGCSKDCPLRRAK